MQVRPAARLLLAALLFVAGVPAAYAQFDDDDDGPSYYVPRQPYGGYAAPREPAPRYRRERAAPRRAYVPPPEPEPQPWFFPFGRRREEYQPQPQYRPRPGYQAPRVARPKPPRPRRTVEDAAPEPRRTTRARPVRPAQAAVRRPPVLPKPKPEPTTTIAVFGDSLAEAIADGLDDAFEDAAEVAVVRRTRGEGGLVRADVTNWAKQIAEYVASGPKATYAVIMLGLNDRQPLREGETTHEPLSPRWRELYAERVDAALKPLAGQSIPWVWVGLPPMKNEAYSADLAALNAVYRERVQRAGGIYVDIWPGFVDDQNRYTMQGPDVAGQVGRLRRPDGIHFTPAGARKAAHFAEVELRRMIEGRSKGEPTPAVAATPAGPSPASTPADDTESVDRKILAALPPVPEPEGLPQIARQRPLAGPVLPLTRAEASAGGALMGERPRLEGDAGFTLERALRDGVAPTPRPGRADDFRWPRL